MKDATVIIVAQRISTILHADQILVLDDGKIVGKGTHQELMEQCESYQEIAKSQLSEAELKGACIMERDTLMTPETGAHAWTGTRNGSGREGSGL